MAKPREMPINVLRSCLEYDQETGVIRWTKKIASKVVVGTIAGTASGPRDICIHVDGRNYQASRVAWVLMTGEQPPACVDHINGDTRDNRWCNLRGADASTNGANRGAQRNNRSGIKGVYHYAGKKKPWLARLSVRGEIKLNRFFATNDEAAAAYAEAARQHFGEFARLA